MNIHKLLALGIAIFFGLTISQEMEWIAFNILEISAMVASALFAGATIITGGLASLGKPIRAATVIHETTPHFIILSPPMVI